MPINTYMAVQTIKSPGVEIVEKDLSQIAPSNFGTSVFVPGFANQGPIDEVIQISSREELDLVYGNPTNAAERYFYYTVDELLRSPSNVYASRLPYGAGTGVGFGSKYSALAYPVSLVSSLQQYVFNTAQTTLNNLTAANFSLTLSNGTSYTFGFSGTAFSPAVTSYNAYVKLTGVSPYTPSALVNSLSTAIRELDTAATFLSSGAVLTTTLSGEVIPVYSFASAPVGNTFTGVQSATNNLTLSQGTYVLGQPVHVELTADEYQSIADGSGFTWSQRASAATSIGSVASLGGAGVIVLNKAQTTLNDRYEGYYVGIADNTNVNPGSNYDGILSVKSLNSSLTSTTSYINIPNQTLIFTLSSDYRYGPTNSVSQVMETLTDYNIDNRQDDDLLNVGVFKLRKSIFSTESFKLDYSLEDGLIGSIDYFRTTNSENGGPAVNFFLENSDSKSRNVEILVNDFISNRTGSTSIDQNGIPKKKIRVLTQQLTTNTDATVTGINSAFMSTLTGTLGYADSLYPLGAYSNTTVTTKDLGDIPAKLDRVLDGVRNEDIYDIDIVVEAGLGTIHVAKQATGLPYYDDTTYTGTLSSQIESLRTSGTLSPVGETVRGNYATIFNKLESFCSPSYIGGGRGDCIFIADPIRQILVTGANSKVMSNRSRIFQKDIYWAIRHQLELENTSYATTYGNWAKGYDSFTGQYVWNPFSGYAAAAMARTDAARFPWIAPAGFTNGLLPNVVDLAINPNQKQRDELYRSNINPVSFFPAQGQVIYGQKTLSRKPSAFDRINVRRLFLALERPTRKAAQFFVFEPNTTFTRTRLVNVLTPIFERAKNNEGLYDYLIVCDERNNTADVIDNNQLVVDIYIKPVKASEFILINFFATRTDASFQEIVGA